MKNQVTLEEFQALYALTSHLFDSFHDFTLSCKRGYKLYTTTYNGTPMPFKEWINGQTRELQHLR